MRISDWSSDVCSSDLKRVFSAGPLPGPVNFRGVRLGVMICEDMWAPDVSECLEESGAEILIVINGSPYELNKTEERIQLAVQRSGETGLPPIYVNKVGGQDGLAFDGASFALNAEDRESAGWGKGVSERDELGGGRITKK